MRFPAQAVLAPLLVSLIASCASKKEGAEQGPVKESAAVVTSAKPVASAAGAASATSATASAASAPGSAAPSASVAVVPDPGPPVCRRSSEKVWSAGANKLTGLTTKGFNGKVAVGLALGNDPRVLLVDKDGSAKLMKVKQGAKAARPDPKEGGFRNLMRVSPYDVSGDEARAFIDYRDDYKKEKRRHVWCGPADADEKFLEFDGKSWLDLDPKPTGEEKKKLFSWKKLGGYVELRDCRTFVSRKDNEVWALGSVLRGIEQPDGTNEWKMVLLVDFGQKDDEIVLHEAALKGDPPKPLSFEIPMSRRLKDKGFLIASRFNGSLLVGLLDNNRKLKGAFKTYKGFPTMPDISSTDEEQLVLTTGVGFGADRALKALIVSKNNPDLPADYQPIKLTHSGTADPDASFSAPELTVDEKGQRWLLYIEGPKDKGQLRVVPLGIDLHPSGRGFAVTEGESFASEGRLVALPSGKLVVVYLRDKEGKTELVSEHLDCEIKK